MKFNVLYLFLFAYIGGVIGATIEPIIINHTNHTDVPTASTVPADAHNTTTVAPTTTSSTTTITPPTTTTPSNNTTTAPTTTTTLPPKTTTPSTTTTTVSPHTTNGTTVTPPTISTSTESTTVVPTAAPGKDRKFDGASFFGGYILASGIMGICYVSYKFYKARTERNYHTL